MSELPEYPFRVSLKGLIMNQEGRILVVKEAGRPFWDLPGGGIEHGVTIKAALTRELYEEVGLTGDFTHEIIFTDDPHVLGNGVHQARLIYLVVPTVLPHKAGTDADGIQYADPRIFEDSDMASERMVFEYWRSLS